MKRRPLLSRLWYGVWKVFYWLLTKLYFRFTYAGGEHVPRAGPVLLLSNHQSHLDPILLGVACPRQLRFLARKSLFFWPLGWYIRSLGAVPVDRDGASAGGLKAALAILKAEEALVVFPEGTRSPDGKISPLKRGFCTLARRGGAFLVPVAMEGAYAAFPRGAWIPRPRRVALCFGAAMSPDEAARLTEEELIRWATDGIAACRRNAAENRGGGVLTDRGG